MIKLDLGCGDDIPNGYIGLDNNPTRDEVIRCDIGEDPLPFTKETVDVIRMCHSLEHLTVRQAYHCMYQCWTVMKEGGVMEIRVPDIASLFQQYLITKSPERKKVILEYIYGSQDLRHGSLNEEGQLHHYGYDKESLVKFMEGFGFEILIAEVRTYNDHVNEIYVEVRK